MADDVVEYLIEDIEDSFDSESYDPDEFYREAVEHLSIYGYERDEEVILEAYENDPYDIDSPHLEILSRFDSDDEGVNLKFVLEDATGDYEVPHIETADSLDDVTLLPREK